MEAKFINGDIKLLASSTIDINENLAHLRFSKLINTDRNLNLKLFKPNSAIRNRFKSLEFKDLEDKLGFTSFFAT